ncbi:MAG: acetate kinase [Cyanobacteria bacterium P01_F01_bin.33]
MNILVLNAGSSSQKSCLYSLSAAQLPDVPPKPIWEGAIDWTDRPGKARLSVKSSAGKPLEKMLPCEDASNSATRSDITRYLLETLWQGETKTIASPADIHAVGHRVVHGGQTYSEAVRVDRTVKATIRALIPLAPAHNPANLAGIEIAEALLGPDTPQFAVFDTAFHSHLPKAAAVYPGPYEWLDWGIRRYGFHGISHEYVAYRAAALLGRSLAELKLITCHLGNGCSLAAIRNGRSIDTTMGFTPLEGLMMGSRSGSVDPGILLYLMRDRGISPDELDMMLHQQSGLKGLSGISNDLRTIQKAISERNERAKLAFDVYIHRIRTGIGAMLASLNGLDALIFTAGVGENSAEVRANVCQAFRFLNLELDSQLNCSRPRDLDIATSESQVRILVVQTQEDWQIASTCWRKINQRDKYRLGSASAVGNGDVDPLLVK